MLRVVILDERGNIVESTEVSSVRKFKSFVKSEVRVHGLLPLVHVNGAWFDLHGEAQGFVIPEEN